MDPLQQLRLLSSDMNLEPDSQREPFCAPVVNGQSWGEIPIMAAQMSGGRPIRLLKTLLSSACERNCYYCPFRAGRNMRRATFKPAEMAKLFIQLHQAGLVEGLFLSSGIVGGGVRTQDQLLDAAEILRKKYGFMGYLHLKIMPGAERDQLERAMHLASRISINLEAPNTDRLERLAPRKEFTRELLQPLIWAQEIRANQSPHRTWNRRWPSTTTQFVVGAVDESDLELLATSEFLYRSNRLSRAYFSTFKPVHDTPFEHLPPENEARTRRLYQASFLLRDYGFDLEEMPFDLQGKLPLDADPKLAWAHRHLRHNPVEVNRASREKLLRVPGIGPRGADAIIRQRRTGKLRNPGDLRRAGIQPARAAPYVLLDGRQPASQLSLFPVNA